MHPFDDTPQCSRIRSHFAALKNLPARIRETELPALEAIMNNPNFDRIANSFEAIEEYFGCELTTGDKPFVALKLMELEESREESHQLEGKLQAGIDTLQEVISSLDEQNTLICEKTKWLSEEVSKYEASLPDLQEQIEIIQSQNEKLKSTPKGGPKKTANNQGQLIHLLSYYRCTDRPFPKNKTEALMLVNRIQSMIQQLEMKKLSSYL